MKEQSFNLISSYKRILNSIFSLSQSKLNTMNKDLQDTINSSFKILILDDISLKVLSPLIKQSSLSQNNICMTLNIKDKKQNLSDVVAIYLVTPKKENLNTILIDIKSKKYDHFSLNFMGNPDENIFQDFILSIISNDCSSLIYNLNVYPIHLFIYHPKILDIGIESPYYLLNSTSIKQEETNDYIEKIASSLFSIMFLFKISPVIKYRNDSIMDEIIKKVQNKFNSTFAKFPELKNEFDFSNKLNSIHNNKNLFVILNRDEDLAIMLHHGESLGSMVSEVCKMTTDTKYLNNINNKDKNIFVLDPINDYIWNNSLTEPFYNVGEETLKEYKKYFEEMKNLSITTGKNQFGNSNNDSANSDDSNNIEEISRESEKLASNIENLNENKIKGDVLSKYSNIFSYINEQANVRNLGQIFEIEVLLLRTRSKNKEIQEKIATLLESSSTFNKENYYDIFRMCLIDYLVQLNHYYNTGETNNLLTKNDIIDTMKSYYYKEQMENIIDYLENKKNEKNNAGEINKDNEGNSGFASKLFKKGISLFVKGVNKFLSSNPSIIGDLVYALSNGKEVTDFNTFYINEKLYNGYDYGYGNEEFKNVFLFMIGGGCLCEYEYINEIMKDSNLHFIYGCDKLYSPEEFLKDLNRFENK